MTTYSDIRGYRVQYLSSDPTLSTSNEGQVWYNSTEGKLKSLVQIKAWSAGGNLPTTKRFLMGTGIQTAALSAGGAGSPAFSNRRDTSEEYNGNTWTAGGNLGTATYGAGAAGTQTASLVFGGSTPPTSYSTLTQSYDGSTWSTPAAVMGSGRQLPAGFGTQTSAVAAGGLEPGTPSAKTENYNGTAWTASGNMGTARYGLAGAGTQTAGLVNGGRPPSSGLTNTEAYDGSTWTAVSASNIGRQYSAASGSQTAAITFGGGNPSITNTAEEYDGTSWTTTVSMATARSALAASNQGPSSSTSAFGGDLGPAISAATEEYFSSIANYDPSSASAWASGGNLNTARGYLGGFGATQTAALAFGGFVPGPYPGTIQTSTENYNGSTWTNVSGLNNGRNGIKGCGTTSAGLGVGGYIPANPTGTPASALVEEWGGSSWTNVTSLPAATNSVPTAGTQTAAISAHPSLGTLYYDGSAWTSLGVPFSGGGGLTGTQTAALSFNSPGTFLWNGSTWTDLGVTLNDPRGIESYAGSAANALAMMGSPASTSVEEYNGSVWTTEKPLSVGRKVGAGSGTTVPQALAFGGYNGSSMTGATEEFTNGSPASPTGAAASTLTTS